MPQLLKTKIIIFTNASKVGNRTIFGTVAEVPKPTIGPQNLAKLEKLKLAGCVSSNTFNPTSGNIAQAIPQKQERNPLDKLMFPDADAFASKPCDIVAGMKPNWIGQKGRFAHYEKLDGKKLVLKANEKYIVELWGGKKFSYQTDSSRRIVSASSDNLVLKPNGRDRYNVTSTLKTPDGYDRGHLFGDLFDGTPEIENLVAMKSQVNQAGGEFFRLETRWKEAIQKGQKVSVNIKINYANTDVPTSFDIRYQIGNNEPVIHPTILN